jgi:hypothetical protein
MRPDPLSAGAWRTVTMRLLCAFNDAAQDKIAQQPRKRPRASMDFPSEMQFIKRVCLPPKQFPKSPSDD